MQTQRCSPLLGANRLPWRVLLLCGLAATWWPVSARAGDADWLWQNPRPVGGACGIWADISFLDAQTGLATYCGGTVLRTDNGGDTWTDAGGDIEGTSHSLHGISITDANTATVVGHITTGKISMRAFVAQTEDGGVTWTEQATDLPARSELRDVFFSQPTTGVAIGINTDPEQPDAFAQPIIIRTDDGGDTWTQASEVVAPPFMGLSGLTCIDVSTCMAVGIGADTLTEAGGALVLQTTDGGDTWATSLYESNSQERNEFNDVACTGSPLCIAVGLGGAIFKSTNGGSSWTQRDSGTIAALYSISCRGSLECLVVGGHDGGEGVILGTNDGGETWLMRASTDRPLQSVDFHGLTDQATAGGSGYFTGYDSFFQTADSGVTWGPHPQFRNIFPTTSGANQAVTLRAVAFADDATGVAVGDARGLDFGPGVLSRTTDGGNTWTRQAIGVLPPLSDVQFVDPNVGVIVGGGTRSGCGTKVVLRTTNNGESWTDLTDAIPGAYDGYLLTSTHFVDGSTGTVVGGAIPRAGCPEPGPLILRTVDGGASWIDQTGSIPPPFSADVLNDVFFSSANVGTVVGAGGRILHTTDGGASWVERSSGTEADLNAVHFGDLDDGWIVGHGVVLRSTDGGATWNDATPKTLPGEFELTDVWFRNANSGVMVGELTVSFPNGETSPPSGVVLSTTDGGETWVMEEGKATRVGRHYGVTPVGSAGWAVVADANGVGNSGFILQKRAEATFLPIDLSPFTDTVCVPEDASEALAVYIGIGAVGGYVGSVELSTTGEPIGVTSELEPMSVDAPGASTWTLTVDGSVSPGQHIIALTGDDGEEQHFANFVLNVVGSEQAPVPLGPTNGATDIDLQPTFTWATIPGVSQYRIQVATDPTFDDVVIDEEVASASFTPSAELGSDTQYFWRVRGGFECLGDDAWSEAFSFITEVEPLAQVSPIRIEIEVPLGSDSSATLDIANIGTGELVWAIEAMQDPVDCDRAPGLIIHDDNTAENGIRGTGPAQSAFVDRFTPAAYPAMFRNVCVAFSQPTQLLSSLDFEVVVFDDDGPGGGPGTELGALSATAEGLPPGGPGVPQIWFSYDISSLGIVVESGSVYVGARWVPPTIAEIFIRMDTSPGNPPGFAGGYWWTNSSGVWTPIVDVSGEYRSLFIRVQEGEGCSQGPWLSVAPDTGGTDGGSSTPVTVTVDTAALQVCEYSARLHITSNDASKPLVIVPISLTVTGSELTLDPQSVDFGEVEAGRASPPEVVTLRNVGVLDATGLEFELVGDAFAVDSSACGAILPVDGECDISVTFTPPGVGTSSGTLQVHSDDGAIATVSLSGQGVPETGIFVPMGLEVDTEPIISDANGVFEPGELAPVAPVWLNDGLFTQFLEGTASDLTGPEGPTYSLLAADADYGEVETGEMASCKESGLCYEMDIGPTGVTRPAPHWDATFDEALSDETTQTWTLHLGDSFVDMPRGNLFYRPVETLLHSGVTDGCTSAEYCPASSNSRAQMAVFLLRAVEGGDYTPPACVVDEEEFFDVPVGNAFCPWIEELAARGVTAGCGGGNYCPADSVTRAQMAVFLLKAAEGDDYVPPPCTGAFSDVLCPSTFAAWIEDLAARGITGGCSETEYCPTTPVTRAQMASFLTRAFGLELYGP